MRIVLVEDNASLAKGIAYRLQDAGHAVDMLDDGLQASDFLRDEPADLVILDINLPGMDGLDVLRGMRDRGDTRPVLLLTARSDTVDRVRGLDAGADDYLVKPFEMAELEARVRALSRRSPQPFRKELTFGRLTLDLDARQVLVDGAPLSLPRREVSLLEALITAEGRTVPKAQLLEHTYGTGSDIEEAAIEAHLSRLRKRLKPYGVRINVQRGLGYAIAPEAAS
ncbi:response regulator transcription factor [Marivita hallyeonensis]|uniref:DNA-binding response regulator, OmpR family, contains REC and winged-helix (WHTH) domain n=1 Tax=Marivita hallyeonensis TaxID=996342 RepID=A0A1M5RVM4_9RHOB|nr:response regulator transcription factor [Marivita hallyeonensis]SHH30088.1 DNA-binding response regulator, OmpR family, contains REC and winged-helix (wHTH) domain [Marivita hallyeonensis]